MINGQTIYRKVITMDLPAVASGEYSAQQKVIEAPCNIMLLDWRAISYSGLTSSSEYVVYIIHGDGLKGAEVWTTKTTVSTVTQAMDKDKFSVFHVGNPTSVILTVIMVHLLQIRDAILFLNILK